MFLLLMSLLFLFHSVNISADIIWPAIIYAGAKYRWYAVIIGFLIEWFIVKKASKYSYKDSFIVSIFMNFASTLIGVGTLVILDISLRFIFHNITGWSWLGRIDVASISGIISWLAFVLFAIIINTLIELLIFFIFYKLFYKKKYGVIKFKTIAIWLILANFLSVSFALILAFIGNYYVFGGK